MEELAYAAQSFGYEGSVPFHNWSMEDLQGELDAGRSVVVSLGANGDYEPGHIVTVTGVSADGGWVSYNDPTLGKQVVSRAEFERLWGSQGNSGVAVRKEAPGEMQGVDPTPWVALAAGLMAAVSGAGLGSLRQGVGGALMGSNGSARKKKKAKNYNDDGGTMSLKKAYKSGRLKAGKKNSKKKNKKKGKKKNSSHGGAKAHSRVLGNDNDPPAPTETQVPTGTTEPEEEVTGTPEPEWWTDNMIPATDVDFPPPIRAPHPPGFQPDAADIDWPDMEGGWISNGVKTLRTTWKLYAARALHFSELDSGYVSVAVDDAIEAGKKISYRGDYGFFGTRYNPSTIGEITAGEIWSGARSNLGLGITLAGTLGANAYDYGWGEHRSEGLGSNEFVASSLVDFGIAGLTGLAAAGSVAGVVAGAGAIGVTAVATAPVTVTIAATALAALLIGAVVDSTVDIDGLKEQVADGIDAWGGIADNAQTILNVAGQNAREERENKIRNGGYPLPR